MLAPPVSLEATMKSLGRQFGLSPEVLRTSGLGHSRLLWSPMVVESVLSNLG